MLKKCLRSIVLNSLESLKGVPVIRTFDKRGGTPSLQTTTTEVWNIHMLYQQLICFSATASSPSSASFVASWPLTLGFSSLLTLGYLPRPIYQ